MGSKRFILHTGINYATFNPALTGTNLSLSGGNLTVTAIYGVGGGGQSLTTVQVNGSKRYWENKIDPTSTGRTAFGVQSSTGSLNNQLGRDATSWAYQMNGAVLNNNTTIATISSYVIGDIIGVALDLIGNTVQFYKNGLALGSAYSVTAGAYYGAYGSQAPPSGDTEIITSNFGQSPFVYSVPAGFTGGIY